MGDEEAKGGGQTPSKEGEGGRDIGEPHEEIREVIRRGLKFSEELIAENEKLRFKLASLEAQGGASPDAAAALELEATVSELKKRVQDLEQEKQRLLASFEEVETQNRDYQSRYAEIEEEHNNLANLYIASYQLHSSLDFREVLQIIAEIVINLVGVHRFGLYLKAGDSSHFEPIFAEGTQPEALAGFDLGEGDLGATLAASEVVLKDEGAWRAMVPLATTDGIVGAIVVEELLVQKSEFNRVDHELFHLLGAHAATALLTALLRHRAGEGALAAALDIKTIKELVAGRPVSGDPG